MIRAILFDLDETLLDRTQSLLNFVRQQYRRFYPHLSHISEEQFVQRVVELDDHGAVWKDVVYRQVLAEHGVTGISWEALLADYVECFAEACVGFARLDETLGALVARGYALGIVTNGRSPFQEANIAALGIAHYFGVILVSEVEGVRKPQPEIFLRAAHRLGVGPKEVVFVGDNPQADIAGAQGCGMKAIWFIPRARGECDFADGVCNGLDEIVDILTRMA